MPVDVRTRAPGGAVATPERRATEAGLTALAAGGNAIDAALSAAAVLTVVYPHNCALGGDLFALVREPDGRTVGINASGPAPRRASARALRRRGPTMPQRGPMSITVPGLVAGWERLHELGARRGWAEALEPAAGLAADGFSISSSLERSLRTEATAIARDPGMAATFAPGGRLLERGGRLRQPRLAATLRHLAERGPREFYDGEVGSRLGASLTAAGVPVDATDLAGMRAETTAPASARFRGTTVITSPPNSSGVLLLQALVGLDAAREVGDPLSDGAGLLARIFELGLAQRQAQLADPGRNAPDLDPWLGKARIAELLETARRPSTAARTGPRPGGDTVAVVAVDDEGRAISLVQSIFDSFGARLLDPATGILMHNRGAFFSLVPGHPNELAPGRRPAHTLMPVLVERDEALAYVLGTMGGEAHAQIHVQVLLRLLAGTSPQEAVAAPRWIVGACRSGEPESTVWVEPGVPRNVVRDLAGAGLRTVAVPRWDETAGHAQVIAVGPDGGLIAGSDPRGDGAPGPDA